jgi:hypothetical protein
MCQGEREMPHKALQVSVGEAASYRKKAIELFGEDRARPSPNAKQPSASAAASDPQQKATNEEMQKLFKLANELYMKQQQ